MSRFRLSESTYNGLALKAKHTLQLHPQTFYSISPLDEKLVMDSTVASTTKGSSDANVELKKLFELRKVMSHSLEGTKLSYTSPNIQQIISNPLEPTQQADTSQLVRTIYGVYSPVPMVS